MLGTAKGYMYDLATHHKPTVGNILNVIMHTDCSTMSGSEITIRTGCVKYHTFLETEG